MRSASMLTAAPNWTYWISLVRLQGCLTQAARLIRGAEIEAILAHKILETGCQEVGCRIARRDLRATIPLLAVPAVDPGDCKSCVTRGPDVVILALSDVQYSLSFHTESLKVGNEVQKRLRIGLGKA